MDITMIGVPTDLGCDRHGPQLAPAVLRQWGVKDVIEKHGHTVLDAGDIQVSERVEADKYKDHSKVKYLDGVVEVGNQLYEMVTTAYLRRTFPFIIGGDHSLSLGSAAAAAHYYDDFGIIWFDAHGDFNMEPASPSGNSHGMPCAALMGLATTDLASVVRRTVNPKNIFWVGTRDLDCGEEALIKSENLNVYRAELVHEKGMDYVIADIKKKMAEQGLKNIHCSIDIDGMDPSLVPGTGTAVPDGIFEDDFRKFITAMFETQCIRSVDVVEFNPALDHDDVTAKWCIEAIDFISSLIK